MNITRVDVINELIKKVQGSSYLEIGVRRGETIARIECSQKVGVDPFLQLEKITPSELSERLKDITFYQITSDEYFKSYKTKFDIIFIDGLHRYEQVILDILNALKCLKENGFIVVHDCNPQNEHSATREWHEGIWNGDAWKAIYDIKQNYPDVKYFVMNEDFGLGILWKESNFDSYKLVFQQEILSLPYSFLEKNREQILNLKEYDFFKKEILAKKKKKAGWSISLHSENMDKVSCIYLVDEFEWNDYIPWKASLLSALVISDEVIVIKGNRQNTNNGESITDFLTSIQNPKIKVIDFDWPENFSWFDIAHALNIGLLNCNYDWCFRLLMDEVIPVEKFKGLKRILRNSSTFDILSVGRYYQLGEHYLYPYIQKELFFRNHSKYTYGRVDPNKAQSLLFDNPIQLIERDNFFELTNDGYKKEFLVYPPLGDRESYKDGVRNLDLFIINTDVNYLPDQMLKKQKMQSMQGYFNLPDEYKHLYKKDVVETSIINDHLNKIEKMAKDSQYIRYYKMPKELLDFIKPFSSDHNSVQRLITNILYSGR
jgi:hypothetical protein